MHLIRCFSSVCFLLLSLTLSFAQTGPAGVGNSTNNVLWLKADAGTSTTVNGNGITAWNDQSGNGINVSQSTVAQQPIFQTNIINGFPAIQFDNATITGENDKLIGPDSPLLDNTAGYTFFTVTRPQAFSDASTIISKRVTLDNQHSFMLLYWNGNKFNTDIQTSNNRFGSSNTFLVNTNYLVDVIYDGTLPAAFRTKLYLGETLHRTAPETHSFVPDNASPLIIGSTHVTDDRPFGGYIPEIIMYRQALDKASRIIVNNYLSAKYNIALASNDKYAGDDPANGDYDREVAGIGMDTIQPGPVTAGNNAFASSIAGGLGISYVSGFSPGDYILAGHASPTNSSIQSDVGGMNGTTNCRWQRIWYIDITNCATVTTDIEFDMSDGSANPNMVSASPSDYVLLYRSAQTGNWTELTTASAITGDKIRFENYALTIDGYYTIGTHECLISPLPVELMSFTAKPSGRNALLSWKTASELNNAGFTLERAANGIDFQAIAFVPGAGTSTEEHAYERTDFNPGEGVHYYRLKQTDINGELTYSDIVSVAFNLEQDQPFVVYPNPNTGTFYVSYTGKPDDRILITITDVSGRIVVQQEMTGEELQTKGVQLQENAVRGYYVATFLVDDLQQVVKIAVE
jgi:hypothetical protein